MPSTFRSIEIARSSLLTSRDALDVTGHNISNASTEGYTRETINQVDVASLDHLSIDSRVGSGVDITSVTRTRDAFLDGQYRDQNAQQNYFNVQQSGFSQIESVINEPSDTALTQSLQDFESSLKQDLANNPNDNSVRSEVREKAQTLIDRFHGLSQNFTSMQSNLDQQIASKVTEVNGYLSNIATLQSQIDKIESLPTYQVPNDLLDQRDELIDKLSNDFNVTVTRGTSSPDSITISSGSNVLFDGTTVTPITASISAGSPTTLSVTPTGGQIGAMLTMRNTTIPNYLTQLDNMAKQLVTNFNAQHEKGFNLSGTPGTNGKNGIDFFDPANVTAATISLSSSITDPVNGLNNIAASANGESGDGANAIALANTLDDGTANSPIELYHTLIGQVGVDSQQSQIALDNANALIKQAAAQRDSISGVSLDEETSNMIKFQYQYQASAKVMSTVDSILDTLINKMI